MQTLEGKVAVVTGAASGIGRALATRFGSEGMRVVLADIEPEALDNAVSELGDAGVTALAVTTDVRKAEDLEELARRTLEAFGTADVLCNNAGVAAGGLSWEQPVCDYEWVLGVNTMGVLHGIRAFVPIMLAQDTEAHIVNTASMAALVSAPYSAPYTMSKQATMALSESLYHELTLAGSKIGVTVLCPELIDTAIGNSERNRPPEFQRRTDDETASPERELFETALRASTATGIDAGHMAERVIQAIGSNRFYALAEKGDPWREACHSRLDDIREQRNPTFVSPVTF